MLANESQYFDALFELFELGNETINNVVWDLISIIPINQEIEKNIFTIGGRIQISGDYD